MKEFRKMEEGYREAKRTVKAYETAPARRFTSFSIRAPFVNYDIAVPLQSLDLRRRHGDGQTC